MTTTLKTTRTVVGLAAAVSLLIQPVDASAVSCCDSGAWLQPSACASSGTPANCCKVDRSANCCDIGQTATTDSDPCNCVCCRQILAPTIPTNSRGPKVDSAGLGFVGLPADECCSDSNGLNRIDNDSGRGLPRLQQRLATLCMWRN